MRRSAPASVTAMRYDGTMLMTERLEACQAFYRDLLGVDC